MNLKKWLWTQKEGLIIGALWGVIAPFGGLGMAVYSETLWWYKFLIFPAWMAGWFGFSPTAGFITSIIIGMIIGGLVDIFYKPKE